MPMSEITETPSPWHAGERTLQQRVGVSEMMEVFGRKVIRPFMPQQHRTFYAQLPMLVVGAVDQDGAPWATLLEGRPGFASSPEPTALRVNALPSADDPALAGLGQDAAIGLLGIELHSRRRNRMNGTVTAQDSAGFVVGVGHAFGNCPQYIQTRHFSFARVPGIGIGQAVQAIDSLDGIAALMIQAADTFFVASYVDPDGDILHRQVDVSHRGGKPGFVRVDGDVLTIPDFAGNFHFNTLGNFVLNPRAGLIFVDFTTGDVLQLSGTVEIEFGGEEVAAFQGAERLWRFHLQKGVLRRDALALRFAFEASSPNSLLTGTWEAAALRQSAQRLGNAWRPFRVTRIVQESAVIRSLYLEPVDGAGCAEFRAGQHLPIRLQLAGDRAPSLRTYTLSSAPSDAFYRISVKRQGRVSEHLHGDTKVGDLIEARAPQGEFGIDPSVRRPVVLLSAGIGVTPMLSMLRHLIFEGQRTRYRRPTWFFHGSRTRAERPFDDELLDLVINQGSGSIAAIQALSKPEPGLKPGVDFHHHGHIDAELLKHVLPFDDYDFYLCGPPSFMQGLYDQLRELRVSDERIHAEAFGPASVKRQADQSIAAQLPPIANEPVQVVFARSSKEARWTPESGTLLELAESRGLAPEFSCRGGSCGTCRTKIEQGRVTYLAVPVAALGENDVLLCCAMPAGGEAGTSRIVLDL